MFESDSQVMQPSSFIWQDNESGWVFPLSIRLLAQGLFTPPSPMNVQTNKREGDNR